MALTHTLVIPSTIIPENPDDVAVPIATYPNAYARVFTIRVHTGVTFLLVVWHEDQAAREREDQPVLMKEFHANTSDLSGDIYPAAYAHLKTLPEFEGAVDC